VFSSTPNQAWHVSDTFIALLLIKQEKVNMMLSVTLRTTILGTKIFASERTSVGISCNVGRWLHRPHNDDVDSIAREHVRYVHLAIRYVWATFDNSGTNRLHGWHTQTHLSDLICTDVDNSGTSRLYSIRLHSGILKHSSSKWRQKNVLEKRWQYLAEVPQQYS